MRTRPDDYPKVFGQNFATRNNAIILSIGSDRYTKYDLGEIGCPHTQSARELHRAVQQLEQDFGRPFRNVHDLVKHQSPEDFVGLSRFGVTAFYALTCVVRDAKIPLSKFYKAKVTVSSLTDAVRKREAENGHKKRRKR